MIMEKKYVKVPFDVEMAKKITEKSVEGRIVTRCGFTARVICWDRFGRDNPLVVLFNNEKDEVVICYNNDGVFSTVKKEDALDLMLEIPEYMTFKDGDVIAYDDNDSIVILKGEPIVGDDDFVSFNFYVDMYRSDLNFYSKKVSLCVDDARKATPEEIEKLKNRLEKDDRQEAKECLKRFFGIEEKPKYQYKDGDLYMTPNGTIGIYSDKYECGWFMPFHIYMNSEGTLVRSNGISGCGIISECKPITSATDRIRIVQALRKDENLISKACLKKYFGDEDWIKHIGFKQCVLVRGSEQDVWVPAEYGYYSEKLASHVVFNGMGWKHCIPYTIHTKHLMGTTDNWEIV